MYRRLRHFSTPVEIMGVIYMWPFLYGGTKGLVSVIITVGAFDSGFIKHPQIAGKSYGC